MSALVRDLRRHGRGGAVRGRARPGSRRFCIRIRVRIRSGWFGHDVFPWPREVRRSVLGDRWLAARRDAATKKMGRARALADARHASASAAGRCGRGRARILARPLPSDTGIVSRDAALRASWAPTIVLTAPMRMSSSGSPGKLAAIRG